MKPQSSVSEWHPNEPITATNHPPCDYCDLGVIEAPCSCFDWPEPGQETPELPAAQPDTERINWLEARKYFEVGIGHNGQHYAYEVRFHDAGLKRFFGRSLRAAIDAAINAEGNKP